MLEGSLPACHLNPLLHHLVHYASKTAQVGCLRWFAMWAFERFNKKVKNLVKNAATPLASIAQNILVDIAARYVALASADSTTAEYDMKWAHTCFCHGRSTICTLTRRETSYLSMRGIHTKTALRYTLANVLGVHFKSGEWGQQRCGSVVTTTYEGRSRYCIVNRFIRVGSTDYVSVEWLTSPRYPYWPIPLVARVMRMTVARLRVMPALVPLEKIDPTPIIVDPDVNGTYFMMRVQGWDRVSPP